MLVRALIGWCCILAVAIANGGLRDAFVRPRYGAFAAELYGAVILSGAAVLAAILVMRPAAGRDMHEALKVSAFWVLLTVAFEFLFFHYAGGQSWSELLAAYRFWEGRLWVVVVIMTAAAPFIALKLRTT